MFGYSTTVIDPTTLLALFTTNGVIRNGQPPFRQTSWRSPKEISSIKRRTMVDKNAHALSMAYRRAVAKSLKIKELGIEPDMTEEQIDGQVKYCAEMKALKEGTEDWKQYLKGQRWYVEDLVAFSKLDAQARLDLEYRNSFPDVATEQEMLNSLQVLC